MKPGDKVRCVGHMDQVLGPQFVQMAPCRPTLGDVYTVRLIHPDGGLLLAEVVNPVHQWPNGEIGEARFHRDWFKVEPLH